MACFGVIIIIYVSKCLKVELATDKNLWDISNIMQLYVCTTKELKNKAVLSLKQYRMHCLRM